MGVCLPDECGRRHDDATTSLGEKQCRPVRRHDSWMQRPCRHVVDHGWKRETLDECGTHAARKQREDSGADG